jgi:putative FmdB family regulatory protein
MPLFEYTCRACAKRFTFLSGVVQDEKLPRCPRCGGEDLQKLMSRCARGRDDDARMDSLGESLDDGRLDDPKALRRFAREMSREIEAETGETLQDDFEELAEEQSTSHSSNETRDETIY